MKKSGILIFIFLFCLSLFANENASMETFKQANQHYEAENFEKAISLYQQLLAENYISDDLHYNLANAYFKTDQLAKSILHYERALKINPANEDAANNLAIANQRTIDKIEAVPELFIYRWWKDIYNLMSANQWGKLAVILIFLATLGFILYRFINRLKIRKISFYGFVIFFILGIISCLLAYQQQRFRTQKTHAIIMNPTANISSSPSEGSSQLFVLHEGTKVKLKEESEGWYKIALPNGNEGWIEKDQIEAI